MILIVFYMIKNKINLAGGNNTPCFFRFA